MNWTEATSTEKMKAQKHPQRKRKKVFLFHFILDEGNEVLEQCLSTNYSPPPLPSPPYKIWHNSQTLNIIFISPGAGSQGNIHLRPLEEFEVEENLPAGKVSVENIIHFQAQTLSVSNWTFCIYFFISIFMIKSLPYGLNIFDYLCLGIKVGEVLCQQL